MKDDIIEKKLDKIIELLQKLLAVELFINNANMADISKNLHVATAKVVHMLKGINKRK
jgi:NADH:ubiquinone oxidoreductase subunit E